MSQWHYAILLGRVSPKHATLLRSKTLNLQAKADKQTGKFPDHPSEATGGRPLARSPAPRRTCSGFLARRLTHHNCEEYIRLNQLGLVPSGLEAGARQLLLQTYLQNPSWSIVGIDFCNAHTSIALKACWWCLHKRWTNTQQPIDLMVCLYFLTFYAEPRQTFIQVSRELRVYYQTDSLDQ